MRIMLGSIQQNLGSGIDDGWLVMLLDHPYFTLFKQLVSRECINVSLILIHNLCVFKSLRFFVDSSTECCGVVEELCPGSESIFRHQSLCRQGDNLEFVVVIRFLSLCVDDCCDFLESTGSFDGFHATPLAALVQHLSLIVKLDDACCFEDLMISVILRLFLSELMIIYNSLTQLQKVQSVEICLCFLSYGIAYDIDTLSEIVSVLCCDEEFVCLVSLLCEVDMKILVNFGGLQLIAFPDGGSYDSFNVTKDAAMVQHSSPWFRLIPLVNQHATATTAFWLMYSKNIGGFKTSIAYIVLVMFTVGERLMKLNLTYILGDVLSADISDVGFNLVCKFMLLKLLSANGNRDFARQWTAFDFGSQVFLQGQSLAYEFHGQIMKAHSGWCGSLLGFFYGSLPRPP